MQTSGLWLLISGIEYRVSLLIIVVRLCVDVVYVLYVCVYCVVLTNVLGRIVVLGNYEGILGFQKCDYEQPECIREMISKRDGAPDMIPVPADIGDSDEAIGQHTAVFNATMKGQYRRKHLDRPFSPTFWSKKRAVLAMVTNWASFYEQLSMRGCEHVSHFPVFPAYLPAVMPGAVIYKSNKDTLCLMCLEGHVSIIDALAAIGAVEGKSTA